MNILIVGAGPTGLTAACELYRRGFAPRIIDKKSEPSPLSRAVGINPHSLDLLEASGITAALLEKGYKVGQIDLYDGARKIGSLYPSLLPHRFNFMLALPQNETESVMSTALERLGGRVEYGCALTALTFENGKAHAIINNGHPEVYDLVIGADGGHSTVRAAAGIAFPGYDYPTRWSIADFQSYDWPDMGDAFFLPCGRFRFVIKIGEHRYRAVSNEPEALPGIPIPFTVDTIHRTDDFVISVRQAETYQKPPVYLAGDAAHIHSPAGARGMNMGIEDACDLARRIAENDLDGYTEARHPVGKKWISLSENLVRGITATSFFARVLRRTFLFVITIFPAFQKPLLERVSGLK